MKKLKIACPIAIKDPDQMKNIQVKLNNQGHNLSLLVEPYDIFQMDTDDFDMIIFEPGIHELKWLDILIGVRQEFPQTPVILYSDHFPKQVLRRFHKNQLVYFSGHIDIILEKLEAIIKKNEKIKKHILFVDDDTSILRLYDRMLKQTPWEAFTAESGEDALEILKNTKIDLVFTDIKMPNMHGLELISKIQSTYGDMPIVACSAYPKLKDDADLKFQKIVKFLVKPIDLDILTQTIKNALN